VGRLKGEALDLDTLAASLSGEDLIVARLGEAYYLRARDFQGVSSSESGAVERRAEEIIRVVNGAAQVLLGNHHSVEVDRVALVTETGAIQHFVHMSGTVMGRARIEAALETCGASERPASPSEVEVFSRLGLVREDVERALRIFGREDVDWRDLYFVFEIVGASAGGRMFREGWITRDEARRFTHTANSPAVLADEARHGHERSSQPPTNPMAFGEAKEAVRLLLASWLRAESSH
jgi:hypothetical protein